MAFESTAIHELIAGVHNRPLEDASSNWLLDDGEDPTEIAPPPVHVPEEPPPFAHAARFAHPGPVDYPVYRSSSPTTHVRALDWRMVGKRLALPVGLISLVSVVFAVYLATRGETSASAATSSASALIAKQPAASQTPIVVPAAKPAPAAAARAAVAEPTVAVTTTVTPIETAPPAATPAAPVAPAPIAAKPPAPSQPAVHVEPGSPASRFLAAPPAEPTIPTVAPTPAPAPQTVPDLAPPSPAPVETAARAEGIAKPAVKAKPARRTAAQRRADRRAAAKRIARLRAERRATLRARKPAAQAARTETARSRKDVAAVARGKGVLSIASSPSLQVWVDGRNSRAMTPVRIILRPGKHKVTLIDAKAGTSRAFTVAIEDGETTRIVKNYR